MKKMIKYTLMIGLFFILLASCEKEPITDIEKIEKELKTVVKNNGITKCSVIEYDKNLNPMTVFSDSDFSFSGGNLVIKNYLINGKQYEKRYNLLYLSNYVFSGSYISFYFTNING